MNNPPSSNHSPLEGESAIQERQLAGEPVGGVTPRRAVMNNPPSSNHSPLEGESAIQERQLAGEPVGGNHSPLEGESHPAEPPGDSGCGGGRGARTHKPKKIIRGEKLRGADKMARIPIRIEPLPREKLLRKPRWIRASFTGTPEVAALKKILRAKGLHTVCEEAACPNLGECFGNGTATFMIMGDICTRRCPFCDVGHGRPNPLDPAEPENLAQTVAAMKLQYVVITSVDRDDLRDGGAGHFVDCIEAVRTHSPQTRIEILTPDFRGRMEKAVDILARAPSDVFNHNLETVPRLYREVRPGSDYQYSLDLLRRVKRRHPELPTKSGLMLGLGESRAEIVEVMEDLVNHQVGMLTLGQYLQPGIHHLPVRRYWHPDEFESLRETAESIGFTSVAAGAMVRSSYHADLQAKIMHS